MTLSVDQLKKAIQDHFTDGLVLIIGSGLSMAEGIPGMQELANHLQQQIPGKLGNNTTEWKAVSPLINQKGLESALLEKPPSKELENIIGDTVANYIFLAENKAIGDIFRGQKKLRLTKLISKLIKPRTGIPIITTNYDRLVEIAVEEAGLGVDTLFCGRFAAPFNPEMSAHSFCTGVAARGSLRTPSLITRDRAIIYKPHGSLDWYSRNGSPVYCPYEIEGLQRLIITPGHNKFQNGYARPFDVHRSKANEEINKGAPLLTPLACAQGLL